VALSRTAVGLGHTFGSEELARDIERLTSDDNNLLAVQELFCDDAGEATKQVTLAVNDNLSLLVECASVGRVSAEEELTTGSKDDILP
jgi:hypothetical protein